MAGLDRQPGLGPVAAAEMFQSEFKQSRIVQPANVLTLGITVTHWSIKVFKTLIEKVTEDPKGGSKV